MPRPKRIWQCECPYSIVTRVNNREFHLKKQVVLEIFYGVFDHLAQLKKKTQTAAGEVMVRKYEFRIQHFLLMDNHYHLVISVAGDTRIDRVMQLINSLTARLINKRLGRTGHLWGERYKMRVLQTLDYLAKTVRYIYQNPVRANMVARALNYCRSTLGFYLEMGVGRYPPWFSMDEAILEICGRAKEVFVSLIDEPISWDQVELSTI